MLPSLNKRKVSIKIVEIAFNLAYLSAIIIIAGFLVSSSNGVKILTGIAAFILFVGDFFHLAPRILAMLTKNTSRYHKAIGIGKAATSISMTFFYLLIWLSLPSQYPFDSLLIQVSTSIILVLVIFRIAICFSKKNNWSEKEFNIFSIYRNIPFLLIGLIVSGFYFAGHAQYGGKLLLVPILILLSYAFYVPVVLFAHKIPKMGMLMLPKSLAYVGILLVFLMA